MKVVVPVKDILPNPWQARKKMDRESIRALAQSTGRSYGFVHRMLSESGVTLRGRGGATRGKAKTA